MNLYMFKNKLPSLDNPNFRKNNKRFRAGICMQIGYLVNFRDLLVPFHFFFKKVHIWVKNGKNVTEMIYCNIWPYI